MSFDYNDPFYKIVKRALKFYKLSLDPTNECPLFPDHIHLEPTNSCNLRCIHCHQSSRNTHFTNKLGLMDFELFKTVLDDVKGKVSRITLNQQGEPLLHPRLLEMVEYAKSSGFSVSLLTNATRLNSHTTEKLLDIGLDRIVFSFDAVEEKLYEEIRIKSNFKKTLWNVLNFIKRNYETGRKTFICASMVLFSKTENHVKEYNEYFDALPVDTVFNSKILSMSGASQVSNEINMQKLHDQFKNKKPVCKLPWETIVVNWDGSVSACPLDYNGSHKVGNVNDTSLIEIWNSDLMKKFRECHLNNDFSWIEESGALCESCNGRYFEDYDLRNLENEIPVYIVRQAAVHSSQMSHANSNETSVESEGKYENLLQEIAKLEKDGFTPK